ncbi:MAG: hypothetical protein ACU88J_07565 [Gammaproteobacteria bacterium]
MTFEEYWKTQPHTLDEETNTLMQQVAEHAWNRATEIERKLSDKAMLEAIAVLDSGIIIY